MAANIGGCGELGASHVLGVEALPPGGAVCAGLPPSGRGMGAPETDGGYWKGAGCSGLGGFSQLVLIFIRSIRKLDLQASRP